MLIGSSQYTYSLIEVLRISVFSATSEVSLINHEDRGRERNKDVYTGCLSKVIELTKAVDMLYTHTTIITIESSRPIIDGAIHVEDDLIADLDKTDNLQAKYTSEEEYDISTASSSQPHLHICIQSRLTSGSECRR